MRGYFPVALFAVDPDATSLKVAQERFKQMPNSENVRSIEYLESIQQLPESLDLCVLSTTSDIRLKLLDELVDHTQVKYVIFEKVIFQSTLINSKKKNTCLHKVCKCIHGIHVVSVTMVTASMQIHDQSCRTFLLHVQLNLYP